MGIKRGYIKEFDAVSISPDGTKGETITISDLDIILPAPPKAKSRIRYHAKRKELQYWTRENLPIGYNTSTYKAPKFAKYIKEEMHRRDHGLWFMNNGELEYITGAHWMLLQWAKTKADGGYYYFTKAQQKLFYFLEACWHDHRCFGTIFEKIRRFGATDCALVYEYLRSIQYKDSDFGMTSKTNEDAKKNFVRLVHMFKNMPPHFVPVNRGETNTKIEFRAAVQKGRKDKIQRDDVKELNNTLDYEATKESSYDGGKLRFYIMDEGSKWEKGTGCTIKHTRQIRKALSKGAMVYGKAFILSTVENVLGNKPMGKDAGCGDKYKYLYFRSDVKNRNSNGQTETGFYKLFISSYEHYEGFIDKYGHPILEDPEEPVMNAEGEMKEIGIRTWIANEMEAIKDDPQALSDYLHKTPINEEDGFSIVAEDSLFDTARIIQHTQHNDAMLQENKIVGNLSWSDGFGSRPIFYPDSANGRISLYKKPPKELRNLGYESKLPVNKHIFVGGVDPYAKSQTVDGRGSKGAIHVYAKTNGAGVEGEVFYLEYVERVKSIETFWDDVIKIGVYFSCEMLIENNAEGGLLRYMYNNGYTAYSMRRPDKHLSKLSDPEKQFGGMPNSSENIKQAHATGLEAYIQNYIGKATTNRFREVGTFHPMPFNRTLKDWMAFDISARTKYDATISSGLALFAAQNRKIENTDLERPGLIGLKTYYSNANNTAVRL